MDVNKIGLYIGLIALMLAVPLAIIANLLTPRVGEWFSTTSQKRLSKRVSALEEKLQASEKAWTFTNAEWMLFNQTANGLRLLFAAFHGLFSIIFFALVAYSELLERLPVWHAVRKLWLIGIMVVMVYVLNIIVFWKRIRRHGRIRAMHTVIGRSELKEEIERLTSQQ